MASQPMHTKDGHRLHRVEPCWFSRTRFQQTWTCFSSQQSSDTPPLAWDVRPPSSDASTSSNLGNRCGIFGDDADHPARHQAKPQHSVEGSRCCGGPLPIGRSWRPGFQNGLNLRPSGLHSGILPCFFAGLVSRLFSSESNASINRARVSRGMRISSTYPSSAARYGLANLSL
jgi:hypothetical protein